jgi:predicted nicotinamide N-methyase
MPLILVVVGSIRPCPRLALLLLLLLVATGWLGDAFLISNHGRKPVRIRSFLLARGRNARKQTAKKKVQTNKIFQEAEASASMNKNKNVVPKPSNTRNVVLSLEQKSKLQPNLPVCVVQVDDDPSWWEHPENTNPFGAKLWPSAMGMAQFLARLDDFDNTQYVLELGCGCGLVSIVAARLGGTVCATDISQVVLGLTREGWQNTQQQTTHAATGMLSTEIFDLYSSSSLPLPKISDSKTTPRPIVLAAAMMYESDLAEALAKRAVEACQLGAWVIIGDDDTGERENGRNRFQAELDRLEEMPSNDALTIDRVWTNTIVKCKALGWSEKSVKLLHLNPPSGICF